MADRKDTEAGALLVRLGFDLSTLTEAPSFGGVWVRGVDERRSWLRVRAGRTESFVQWPTEVRDEAWAALRADAVALHGADSWQVKAFDYATGSLKSEVDPWMA